MGFLGVELPRLRLMTQAGGRLDPVLASQFLDALEPRGVRFQAMYGQSEATARIAVVPPAFARTKLGSAGCAVPGTTLSVEEGRVRVRGPSVMLGYAEGRRDLGRGDELGGVLDTGDLGSIDDDGFLWIQGRSSRFAKLFGVRFNLDDLEASLASFGPVAVVERQEKLVVVMEERAEPTRVLDALATRFGVQPMSVRVRTGEPLPRLASGKVAYGELA
jgi:acyl-coenzyme A synthetase/AMP-(fatty) acid ligase